MTDQLTLAILGLGTMGQAIARGLVRGGAEPSSLILHDHGPAKKSIADELGARWCDDAVEAANAADAVMIAVKPKDVADVVAHIRTALAGRTLVSIVGGLGMDELDALVLDATPIVRIMPNTPVEYGEGVCILTRNAFVDDDLAAALTQTFERLGLVAELPEKLMDAATALTGCGPAFVYQVIEGLSDGAVALGLPRAQSYELAAAMVRGAATTVLESGRHPGQLKDAVCTPGGSTIRGVLSLEEDGVRAAFSHAIKAAAGQK